MWNQVNLEYLGRVVFNTDGVLYPDSVVGTDSHTTMIDGLGVAGWGVGGIEAEAAMLGQMAEVLAALRSLMAALSPPLQTPWSFHPKNITRASMFPITIEDANSFLDSREVQDWLDARRITSLR